MSDLIQLELNEAIATITLNNPSRRNALTRPAWVALGETISRLDQDDSLRCIILRGAGDAAFAAGADISEFPEQRSNADQARDYGEIVTKTLLAISHCQHPTIAMIKGACTGGGLEIACACDMRICGSGAKFGVPINRLGHTLAYPEVAAILNLVSPALMLELLLEGRIIDADAAKAAGLVNRVVDDWAVEEEVQETAEKIAAGAPLAARLHKKIIRQLGSGAPISAQDMDEPFLICDSDDYQNGFRAFMNKQKPTFSGK